MTDERGKPSTGRDSAVRPTARDVPYVRPDSTAESAPLAQRPAQLPKDPTYEAELALVDLAVLRDPRRTDDPSTRPGGGGRRGYEAAALPPPESVTPESPGTRAARQAGSPEPPISASHSVASGTLLSVGAVDPRGKTERDMETPRLFLSQADADAEVYFRPGRIPAVTVHQTLETETVKLSDSVDPRRADTLPPRGERAARDRAERERATRERATRERAAAQREELASYPANPEPLPREHDGQIHASLSQFREDDGAQSFSLDAVSTRPEPLAARRFLEPGPEESTPPPDPSSIPTHRDLPAHRIEASAPPPPLASEAVTLVAMRKPPIDDSGAGPFSEGPRPTTASIAAEDDGARPFWHNYVAFTAALLVAVALGLLWTQSREAREERPTPPEALRVAPPSEPASTEPTPPAPPTIATVAPAPAPTPAPSPRAQPVAPAPRAVPQAAPTPPAPNRSPSQSKPSRETIF